MISRPYDVLGVLESATDDELKKAYKNLSKKYHPDANLNNPEYAEQKFKEVQEAYRQIMDARARGTSANAGPQGGGSYGGYGQSSNQQNYYGGFGGFEDFWNAWNTQSGYQDSEQSQSDSPKMRAARNFINSRHFQEALRVLNEIPERTARWYYYSALANNGIGNNATAMEHAEKATAMEPTNREYRIFYQQMQGGSSWYENRGSRYGRRSINIGSCITAICVINMLLNCFFRGSYLGNCGGYGTGC